MKRKEIVSLCVLYCALTASVQAAQLTNESFDAGANGWAGTVDPLVNSGLWNFSGGEARVTFFDTTPTPIFDFGLLSNGPTASSGSFTGNYDAAGINVIGFTFQAPTILPGGGSTVVLRWGGSTSVYQKAFSVAQTAVWYNFSMSLADAAKYEWDLYTGNYDDFTAARQSVDFVTIRFFRGGIAQHDFVVGSIYLGNEPEAGALIVSGSNVTLGASALLPGESYDVESAPEVTGTWAFAESFTATNTMQWISLTNSAPRQFWRLLKP